MPTSSSRCRCADKRRGSPVTLASDDRNAFVVEVAAKHGQRLRRFLAARLAVAADVADLAQEVYLRLLRVEHHDQIRSPEGYLLTIASHAVYQHALNAAAVPEGVDWMDVLTDEQLLCD